MNEQEVALSADSLVLCPHCRRWHPVIKGHTEGTPYTQAMLYFECKRLRYYAGQVGLRSTSAGEMATVQREMDRVDLEIGAMPESKSFHNWWTTSLKTPMARMTKRNPNAH
jgi:hypothetical protein